MLRLISSIAIVLTACGGGSSGGLDPDDEVPALLLDDQELLCEQFLDDICAGPIAAFCDDPCIVSSCGVAASSGDIDEQCAGITVGQVEDCAETSDAAVCMEGGGCMFDALEEQCSPP